MAYYESSLMNFSKTHHTTIVTFSYSILSYQRNKEKKKDKVVHTIAAVTTT